LQHINNYNAVFILESCYCQTLCLF